MILPIVCSTLKLIQHHLIPDKSQIYPLEWICPKQLQDDSVLIDDPFLTDCVWLQGYEKELAKCKRYIPYNQQSRRPLHAAPDSTTKLGVQLRLLRKHVSNHIWSTLRSYGYDYGEGLDICFIDGNIGEGKSTALARYANSGHIVAIENLTQFTTTFQTVSGVGMLQARYENLERIKFLRNSLNMRLDDDCAEASVEDVNNLFELLTLGLNLVIYQFYFATSQCESILDAIRRRFECGILQKKKIEVDAAAAAAASAEKATKRCILCSSEKCCLSAAVDAAEEKKRIYHNQPPRFENGEDTIFVERSFTNTARAFMCKEDYMLDPTLVRKFISEKLLPKPTMEKLGGFMADFEIMVDGCINLNTALCRLFEVHAKYHRVPQIGDINELLVRIRARGRQAEKGITPEYLTVIAKKLDKFFTTRMNVIFGKQLV